MGEFYKMDFDAWDEGTADLTLEEEAAYLRIVNQLYRRKQPMPNSERLLCSLWRCHQNKARPLLQRLIEKGKIVITPEGHLTNTRVGRELDARQTLATQRADAGHTGGTRSAEARRKPLKNNEQTQAKSSREEKSRGEENRGEEIRAPELTLEPTPPKGSRKRKPETTIPDIFPITAEHIKFAVDRKFTESEARTMFDRFKNWHQSKGSRYVDWNACWRTWVGKQVDYRQDRDPSGHTPYSNSPII